MSYTVAYNESFYRSAHLKQWANKYLKHIPKTTTHLVSSGCSGASIASAILTLADWPLLHFCVKTRTQAKHSVGGALYSGLYSNNTQHEYVFVDDFIYSGTTFRRVLRFCQENQIKVSKIVISSINPNAKGFMTDKTYYGIPYAECA